MRLTRLRLVQVGLAAIAAMTFVGASCGDITKDTDGDGVPDVIDQCPLEPGPVENLGCPIPPVEAYDCDNPPALRGFIPSRSAIPDRYIVVLKRGVGLRSRALTTSIATRLGAKNIMTFDERILSGFAAKLERKNLKKILADPDVQYVQQEGRKSLPPVFKGTAAASLSWGLDRIDAREGLDGKFSPLYSGTNVHIIINDTGVTKTADLGDRLSDQCFSTVILRGCEDGHGHGTFVAGTAAGTTWGVAKSAIVHSDRFLDEQGSGTDSDGIRTMEKAVEWANADKSVRWVINMSWGGSPAPALDAAVCKVIEAGVVAVAAAGNEEQDSRNSTPARILQVVTVGAMDRNDKMAYFSNFGPNVDLFAPGVDIESDTPTGGTTTMSGTSMATPHVVGGAALYLEAHRTATPAEVEAGLVSESTPDTLSGLPAETPNRLLFVLPTGGQEGTPPKGTPVGPEFLLSRSGSTVVDTEGKRVDLFQSILCCRTPVTPEGAKPRVRRPRPVRVNGTVINARWPCIGPEAMDFLSGYKSDDFHCRLGPFYADEETESDFIDIGGPYLASGEPNEAFWQFTRDQAFHASKISAREEVVPLDSWAFKYSQAGNRYVPFPQPVIDAFGHEWRPEFDRHLFLVAESLGCYGNLRIALDNEGQSIRNYDPEFYRTMLKRWRELEQQVGCGYRHPVGTSIPELFTDPDIDYTITHDTSPLLAPDRPDRWKVDNEHNPALSPVEEESRFKQARARGLLWALWRDDMEDAAFYDTLGRFKAVVEGATPPPPPTCTLNTPTARQMAAAGKQPTIKVQRTVAGADTGPNAGKWITGTPVASFGRDYYCQPGMNWPEACAQPPSPGPVAPEGHPQRVACEAQFLEQPCPTFLQDHCTGIGEQCPITFDTYIVIDGVNQLHPDNVAAGCRESTYVKDPDGRLLSGEWWKATAHGKGFIRACNFDGSVCGVSSFEINQ